MHKLRGVSRVERERRLRQHAHESRRRDHSLALERAAELLAVQELHDERVGAVVRGLEAEHLDDVLVRQRALT
jgi:hypothetical protein